MTAALAGRRCLVTGAGGFIGSALCRALAGAGAEVHGLVRPGGSRWRLPSLPPAVRLAEADLRDAAAVREAVRRLRPVIFHAAAHPARGYGGPLTAVVADDVLAVAHLLEAAAAEGVERFVHLGSSLEMGPAEEPLREDHPLRPASLRGATKAAASLLVLERARSGAVPATVVRPFHVYGPWEGADRLVPAAIRAALTGEPLPLAPAGSFRRDPVFVADLADACLAAAVVPAAVGEAFHVGSGGRGVTNEELVAAVEAAVGRPIEVEPGAFPPRPTDTGRRVADPAKARRLLGWRPAHDLAAGLAATVAWARERAGRGLP